MPVYVVEKRQLQLMMSFNLDISCITLQFVQMILVSVVTGMFWFQRGQDYTLQGAADAAGLLFFECQFASFQSLFAALFT